jgi:hypothetical protein
MSEQKIIKCKLNGKQSVTIPVQLTKNGYLLTTDTQISVRGFLKFNSSENSSSSSASVVSVYPVIFTSSIVTAVNGKTTITLMPRSEDVLQDYKSIQGRINYNKINVTDADIIYETNIAQNEQLKENTIGATNIVIETGIPRNPYTISIEISILDNTGVYYGRTINKTSVSTVAAVDILNISKSTPINNLIITCYNDEDWTPVVKSLIETATADDAIDIINILEDATPFGCSPIFDAITSVSDILVSQNSSSSSGNLRKLLYVFTDNDSNISLATIDESIEAVNNIDGKKQTPVIIANFSTSTPLTLSANANTTDTRDLNKISYLTGGQTLSVISETDEALKDIVKVFYNEAVGSLGYGTYSFVIDLLKITTIDSIEANFTIPDETSNASWDIEISDDNYSFSSLEEKYSPNEEVDYSTKNIKARYIKVNIIMLTGFNYDDEYGMALTPTFDSIVINYNQSKTTYLYLKAKEDELHPYQVTFAVDATGTDKGTIEVGLAQSDAINWLDFQNDSQPSVNQNGKIIVPIRFVNNTSDFEREPLIKINSFCLKTSYGTFDPNSSITIYNKDEEIITEDKYKIFPREGLVVFNFKLPVDYQNGDYRINIINSNVYKTGLKITNTTNTQPIIIYGIGNIYTTSKDLLPPIEKLAPEATDIIISPSTTEIYGGISVSYVFSDSNADKEDITKRNIKWYVNNINIPYLNNITKWNDISDTSDILFSKIFTFSLSDLNDGETVLERARSLNQSILKVGDKIYCTVQVSDGQLYSRPTKSNIISVVESMPIAYGVIIKGIKQPGNVLVDTITTNTAALAMFNFYSDTSTNKSEIIWFVNGQEFKRGIYGTATTNNPLPDRIVPGDVSNSYPDIALRIGNEIYFQIVPNSGELSGQVITSDIVIVNNDPPSAIDVKIVPPAPILGQNILLTWKMFDFEIDFLKDTPQAYPSDANSITPHFVQWFRKRSGGSTFEEVTDSESLALISTNIVNKASTVSSNLLFQGDQFYAVINPHDGVSFGDPVVSNIVVIG